MTRKRFISTFLRTAPLLLAAQLVLFLTNPPASALQQADFDGLTDKYQSITTKLMEHCNHGGEEYKRNTTRETGACWWIDDDQESFELLTHQWALAADWIAAWLNLHPTAGAEDIRAELGWLMQKTSSKHEMPDPLPQVVKLADYTFLIVSPSDIGNVFIIAPVAGEFSLAWNTSQPQEASGELAQAMEVWRPEKARFNDWRALGAGPITFISVGALPQDQKGHVRFYIEGEYAQMAGGTRVRQISVWQWDGATARLQIARPYTFMINQAVGTRVKGDLLIVQEKKLFRTFYACDMCEERQTDWTIRLTPYSIEDHGEQSMVPELDIVDELFYRAIHGEAETDVSTPAVMKTATDLVKEVRDTKSVKEWQQYPRLGMMTGWKIRDTRNDKIFCFALDIGKSYLFTLQSNDGRYFITSMKPTSESCRK